MFGIALMGFAGFAALCLAMEKHFKELLKRSPDARRGKALRLGGWALLLTSLSLAVHLRGWAHGLVEWIAVSMAGVAAWVFVLPYRPRLLLGLAAASAVLGPLLAVFTL
ncbi:DUF3325 domain-containing protein [Pseudomonas sp. UBA6562]|uniref:DUF3325 domain-containing protein n=1 Tax=Pseudomonas sp. UBA6562 TaxID=1947332 RepID=UPI0025D1E4EF|nr:DUF3325 domain-containing protein [Pseudomonas sp. UBA6562]